MACIYPDPLPRLHSHPHTLQHPNSPKRAEFSPWPISRASGWRARSGQAGRQGDSVPWPSSGYLRKKHILIAPFLPQHTIYIYLHEQGTERDDCRLRSIDLISSGSFEKLGKAHRISKALRKTLQGGRGRLSFPPYIRSKGLVNRPRAARHAPTPEIIIIMTRYKGARADVMSIN